MRGRIEDGKSAGGLCYGYRVVKALNVGTVTSGDREVVAEEARISEGEITSLHIGLKGTMNAMHLDELAQKTRRGLRGRVEAGRSGGGLIYGYRVVHVPDGEGRGERETVAAEAAIVQRIFRSFVAGVSPKMICKALNAEKVAGPRGVAWSPSTIHGHAGRGTGILNNELYVGRLVWNRQRYVKNPDTGKRVAQPNPPEEWIATNVPELRIIADDLWQVAKERQGGTRRAVQTGIVHARGGRSISSLGSRSAACAAAATRCRRAIR